MKSRTKNKRGCPTCQGVDPKSCMRCYGKTYLKDWDTELPSDQQQNHKDKNLCKSIHK